MIYVFYYALKNAPLVVARSWRQATFLTIFNSSYIVFFAELNLKLCIVVFDILMEIELVYYLLYGLFSIFGLLIHPLFFAYHLSEIVIRYPSLKNITLSVWEPKMMLILTMYFLVFLTYYAAILGYIYFDEAT